MARRRFTTRALSLKFAEQTSENADVIQEILNDYGQMVYNYLVLGESYKMMYGMGWLYIGKTRQKPQIMINWVETKKQGTLVPYTNIHSDGYVYKFSWIKPKEFALRSFTGKYWQFTPNKKMKRRFSNMIKEEGYIDYKPLSYYAKYKNYNKRFY